MDQIRKLISIVTILTLIAAAPSTYAAPSRSRANESVSAGPRKHLQTIVFAGLAGAILGLSTLSFYGRPQDKLSNIAVGFAIGVISGTIYSTYRAATEPKDFYNLRDTNPETWALMDSQRTMGQGLAAPAFNPSFTFEF